MGQHLDLPFNGFCWEFSKHTNIGHWGILENKADQVPSTKYWVSCPLEAIQVGEGTVWEARSLIANICIPKTSYRLHILYNCICQNDQHLEKVKTMCSTFELGEIKDKSWNLNHMEQCKKNHQITDTTISNLGYNAKSRGIFDDF